MELTGRTMEALNRLKTARGHLDGVIRMLESDAYCVDVMKQVSAVAGALERVNRVILQNHLETCFSEAVRAGRGQSAIEELLDAVKFSPVPNASEPGGAASDGADSAVRQRAQGVRRQ